MALPFLEVTDLACRRGGRPVFDCLSFGLGEGELLALTGHPITTSQLWTDYDAHILENMP